MWVLMGVSKNEHGVYHARRRVPKHLRKAVALVLGRNTDEQAWLKRSLGTKDLREANKRAKAVLIEFDRTLERAEALGAERPLRDSLSAVEITRMGEYHFSHVLAADDAFMRDAPSIEAEYRDLDGVPGETWSEPVPEFGRS